MAWRVLVSGEHSAISEFRQIEVNDADAWRAAWEEHGAIFDPLPELPVVDWRRERVSGLFLGFRPTAGSRIEVTGVRRTGGQFHVEARVRKTEGVRLPVVTHPHAVLALPKGPDPVVWTVEGLHSQGRNTALRPLAEDPPGSDTP